MLPRLQLFLDGTVIYTHHLPELPLPCLGFSCQSSAVPKSLLPTVASVIQGCSQPLVQEEVRLLVNACQSSGCESVPLKETWTFTGRVLMPADCYHLIITLAEMSLQGQVWKLVGLKAVFSEDPETGNHVINSTFLGLSSMRNSEGTENHK